MCETGIHPTSFEGHPVTFIGKSSLGWCSVPYDWNELKLVIRSYDADVQCERTFYL